jgi:hypothetical protein
MGGGMDVDLKPGWLDTDRLYQEHVKPLERTHHGEYVGVSFDGRTVIGPTLLDVIGRSAATFGKGRSVVFRVGDKVVGRIR